jgi:hypothetical protein
MADVASTRLARIKAFPLRIWAYIKAEKNKTKERFACRLNWTFA